MKFVPDGRKFEVDGQEYELKGWMVNDDPKPIYLDKVPVCLMPANALNWMFRKNAELDMEF